MEHISKFLPKKYKVEYQKSETYCVDVLAKDEAEAKRLADAKWQEIEKSNTEHYYQTGDTVVEVGTVYDVTNTDDTFNS